MDESPIGLERDGPGAKLSRGYFGQGIEREFPAVDCVQGVGSDVVGAFACARAFPTPARQKHQGRHHEEKRPEASAWNGRAKEERGYLGFHDVNIARTIHFHN